MDYEISSRTENSVTIKLDIIDVTIKLPHSFMSDSEITTYLNNYVAMIHNSPKPTTPEPVPAPTPEEIVLMLKAKMLHMIDSTSVIIANNSTKVDLWTMYQAELTTIRDQFNTLGLITWPIPPEVLNDSLGNPLTDTNGIPLCETCRSFSVIPQ